MSLNITSDPHDGKKTEHYSSSPSELAETHMMMDSGNSEVEKINQLRTKLKNVMSDEELDEIEDLLDALEEQLKTPEIDSIEDIDWEDSEWGNKDIRFDTSDISGPRWGTGGDKKDTGDNDETFIGKTRSLSINKTEGTWTMDKIKEQSASDESDDEDNS